MREILLRGGERERERGSERDVTMREGERKRERGWECKRCCCERGRGRKRERERAITAPEENYLVYLQYRFPFLSARHTDRS